MDQKEKEWNASCLTVNGKIRVDWCIFSELIFIWSFLSIHINSILDVMPIRFVVIFFFVLLCVGVRDLEAGATYTRTHTNKRFCHDPFMFLLICNKCFLTQSVCSNLFHSCVHIFDVHFFFHYLNRKDNDTYTYIYERKLSITECIKCIALNSFKWMSWIYINIVDDGNEDDDE